MAGLFVAANRVSPAVTRGASIEPRPVKLIIDKKAIDEMFPARPYRRDARGHSLAHRGQVRRQSGGGLDKSLRREARPRRLHHGSGGSTARGLPRQGRRSGLAADEEHLKQRVREKAVHLAVALRDGVLLRLAAFGHRIDREQLHGPRAASESSGVSR